MTTQRGVGILYTAFSAWVLVSSIVSRIIRNVDVFEPADIVTIFCIIVFTVSIFCESTKCKAMQVLMIIAVGVGTLMSDNYYLSMAVLTNAFFIMYAYGAYSNYTKIKVSASIVLIYVLFLVIPTHEITSILYAFNWLIFMCVHITCIWFVFRLTISKAKQFDQSKEMQLNLKIEEAQEELIKTRAQLEKTRDQLTTAVESGIELLDIVKDLQIGKCK